MSKAVEKNTVAVGTPAQKVKFVIDGGVPASDLIIDVEELMLFLTSKIKVDGKTRNLRGKVDVSVRDVKITVEATMPFSKRYLKYLTRKYLKKLQLRDYVRVLGTRARSYELRYYAGVSDVPAS